MSQEMLRQACHVDAKPLLMCALMASWLPAARAEALRPAVAEMAVARSQAAAWFGPKAARPPFSFVYGGRAGRDLLPGWRAAHTKRKLDGLRTEQTVVWRDPATGLEVRCVAVTYRDFPTVEWTVYFKNSGSADTPVLEEIQALDAGFANTSSRVVLHHNTGDYCTPDSYEPHDSNLAPGESLAFAPEGGRPCNKAFPYFNLEYGGGGAIVAIGWPGQWAAGFSRGVNGALAIRAGQERTHLRLHPGEEVRTPLVVMQFWRGDQVRSHNLWRRWMLAHNTPRTGTGRVPKPLLAACSGGFFPGLKCNEADELRFIDSFLQQGVHLDYWWMDAGWYPCGEWPQTGTWEPDKERFPRGLRAVTDHAHARGLKSIVWFEPERVAPGTWLYQTHPEWLLGREGNQKLLNLGDPAARRWLTDHVDRLLTEQGIDLYRQDFNIDPLPYWRANDGPDRQGITENLHVQGYLAYWDELRRRHPGMLIDSCSSGGRRNDLETLRRAVPLLRSDYQSFQGDVSYAPGNQCHTYGLSAWLPFYGQGVYYNPDHLEYDVRSYYCPAFGLGVDVRKPGTDWARFRRLIDQWRAMADDFLGDFHPLTPYSLADNVWMAWQFDSPEAARGVVQAFRRAGCPDGSIRLRLQGLSPRASYEVRDVDSGGPRAISGRDLMESGLTVELKEKPAAAIITYRRLR